MDRDAGVCEIAICVAPELSSLVAVRVKVGAELLEEYLSYHNAVTVVLRGLAVNNPEILACPGWKDDDFFVVLNEERWKETGWREGLRGVNLEIIQDRMTVTDELFANSVWYSIMCRMAPEWNRVGHLLVQGVDFLVNANNRKYRALEMKVGYLPPGRLQLILTSYTVALSQLTKTDFENDSSVMDVITGKSGYLFFDKGRQWTHSCYVLPKETRGSITMLCKSLPKKSVFDNYGELREYWKSMYGYSLPNHEPEFYCEVIFYGAPSKTVFTYPSCCLLSSKIDASKSNDAEWAQCMKAFVTDLYVKVPFLCGVAMKLVHTPQSVTCKFREASKAPLDSA